jgi:hypothetical protein
MEQGDPVSTIANTEPRNPVVTDRTQMQNLQVNIPADVFIIFDHIARNRGLAKSVLLRRMVEAVAQDMRKLDRLIGRS